MADSSPRDEKRDEKTVPRGQLVRDDFGPIELDVLRGWREARDPALRAPHALPALARLVLQEGPDGPPRNVEGLFGPDVVVGRYSTGHGPVDLYPSGLRDAEIYRLGAPHLRLELRDERWYARALSPGHTTLVEGRRVDASRRVELDAGMRLQLGRVHAVFETGDVTLAGWRESRRALLSEAGGPTLFLVRSGGPCGPRFELSPESPNVIGRSFPRPGDPSAIAACDGYAPPDWDLAGLDEDERRFIGFRHVQIERRDDGWWVTPLGDRHRCTINRQSILESTRIEPGDELALGSVLFELHAPGASARGDAAPRPVPSVVDWGHEHSVPVEEAEISEVTDEERDQAGEDR
jgi:hypothetical protein